MPAVLSPVALPFRRRRRSSGSSVLPIPAAPATPNTPSPTNGATALYRLLSWVSAGATKYDVYLDTATPPVALVSVHQVDATLQATLLPSTTYYWQVVAINDGGSTTGPIWSFSTLAATYVIVTLNGVQVESSCRFDSLHIRDVLNAAPNTLQAVFRSLTPIAGDEILVGLGTLDAADLLFAGLVQAPTQTYLGQPSNLHRPVSAVDYTSELDQRRPFGTFVAVSATTVARTLLGTYAPTFTAAGVQDGLATVSITFDGSENLSTALTRLATMVAGYYGGPDYRRDVRVFSTLTADAPDPLDSAHTFFKVPPVTYTSDLSQLRNSVFGKGHGENVPSDLAAGETILPLEDVSMFNASGGKAIAGTTPEGAQSDVLTYDGLHEGGGGSFVGPGVSPSVQPTLDVAEGLGLDAGLYQYAYTDVTASGDSLPSPIGAVTTGAFPPPTGVMSLSGADLSGTLLHGTYQYAFTYTIASGETLVSPIFTIILGSGSDTYRLYLQGIATGSASVLSRKVYRTVVNGSQLKLLTTLADNLSTTFTDATADGSLGANAPTVATAIAKRVAVSAIAIGPTGTTSRKVYRTAVNGSQLKLLTTLSDNTTTTYADALADSALGANVNTSDTSGLTPPVGQVNAGTTSLLTSGVGPFPVNGGWVILSSGERVRYTGISGNTLTGIPASGSGAILTTVLYGSQVLPAPALTGINHFNGIPRAMQKGSAVHIWVERNDLASQALYGIHEHLISDGRVGETLLAAMCDADLALFKDPIVTVRYDTRDPKTRSGKTVHVDLPAPTSLTGDFVIQDVTITFDAPTVYPRYSVTASSVKFSFEDMLRRVLLAA